MITADMNAIDPNSAISLLQQARQYAMAGELADAEQCYRLVLAEEPDHVEALYRLALLLQQTNGQSEEPLHLLEAAIAAQPGNPLLHSAKAISLAAQKRPLDGMESMAEAACLRAGDLGVLYNFGLLLADLCCPAQMEAIARRLLETCPDWPAAHYLLVRALTALAANPQELEAGYDCLIKADPLNPPLLYARGLQQIRGGNYIAGWEAYEWRWEIEPVKSSRIVSPKPRWAGGPLAGRRILILGEQGFGDVLQFCRYLPLMIEKGAHVILRLDANRAALARLLGRIEQLEVVVEPPELPAHDLYCPLASLPYIFGTTPDNIPPASYLDVDEVDVAAWRERLAAFPRPWIGVCWAGSAEHDHDIRRSLPLCSDSQYFLERRQREQRIGAVAARVAQAWGMDELVRAAALDTAPLRLTMEPMLQERAGSFVSLQVGPHAQALDELPASLRGRFAALLTSEHDFYDTACLVRALDEVITVDTSVAHLTGSLGQRGIVIKPAAPEWRWSERAGRSIWYPSLTLMEQEVLRERMMEEAVSG